MFYESDYESLFDVVCKVDPPADQSTDVMREIIDLLKKTANSHTLTDYIEDDSNTINDLYDYAGNDIYDAFELGEITGSAELARNILSMLKIEWQDS